MSTLSLRVSERVPDSDSAASVSTPVGVARRALAKGVPTVLLAGGLGPGYQELYQHGIAGIVTISDRPMNFPQSLRRTQELLEGAAERTIRLMKVWV